MSFRREHMLISVPCVYSEPGCRPLSDMLAPSQAQGQQVPGIAFSPVPYCPPWFGWADPCLPRHCMTQCRPSPLSSTDMLPSVSVSSFCPPSQNQSSRNKAELLPFSRFSLPQFIVSPSLHPFLNLSRPPPPLAHAHTPLKRSTLSLNSGRLPGQRVGVVSYL